jgi:predicted nucleic acid-binding protein
VIFVDTSFLFPLLSAHDRDHPRVRDVFESLGNRDFTHRFVVKPGPAR